MSWFCGPLIVARRLADEGEREQSVLREMLEEVIEEVLEALKNCGLGKASPHED